MRTLREEAESMLDATADIDAPQAFMAKQSLNTWLDTGVGSERLVRKCIEVLRRYV